MSDRNSSEQLDTPSTHYIGWLEEREVDLEGRRQLAALDEIEADFEDVRAAWSWAVEQKDYDLIDRAVESLDLFCTMRGRRREAEALFELARERLAPGSGEEPHPVWARIVARYPDPDLDRKAQIERSLAIAQKHGDRQEIAYCLRALGEVASTANDNAQALSLYEKSLAHYRALDDGFNVAATLYKLAQAYSHLRQPEKAIEFARQSLELSREIGDKFWAASSLTNTGIIALYTGNYTEAEGYLREANTIYREMGYKAGIAGSNVVLSKLAALRGDPESRALTEEALEIAKDIGSKRVAQFARSLPVAMAMALEERADEHPDVQELAPMTSIPATIDRFKVKELLGAGGLSTVYRAHDPDSGRDVAVKVINPNFIKRWGFMALDLVRREGGIMANLAHPAIPKCYGYGETMDHVYIALEFIEGKTLLSVVEEREGFLPEKDVIEWAIQVCDALIYMHNQRPEPIIHRDVKPSHMMIDDNGHVYLIDFGIVVAHQAGWERTMVGTEGYAPPEQYWGYTDARSDIYALGASLHHVLTRRDPRKEKPWRFHYPPPRSLNTAISEAVEAAILKAVEHHPENRYQSAEEMNAALLVCLRW